jgi:hypothetical protein
MTRHPFPKARRFIPELARIAALCPDTAQTMYRDWEDVLTDWTTHPHLMDACQDALVEVLDRLEA